MATLVLTTVSTCAGGQHVVLSATINGVDKGNQNVVADDVLAAFDDEEIAAFIKGVIRLHKLGKTNAQVKADLAAGLTVTL